MLNSLVASINAVFPIMLMIVTGSGLKKRRMLSPTTGEQINKFVYTILLPIVLFMSIYQSHIPAAVDVGLLIFCTGAIVISFAALMLLVPKYFANKKQRGVIITNILRSNCVLFGLQIAEIIYGVNNVGLIALLMTIVVPLFNILDILALIVTSGEKRSLLEIIHYAFINPLMIMVYIAVFIRFTGITLPVFLVSFLSMMKSLATPLALIVLGAGFEGGELAKNRVPLITVLTGKLVLLPLIVLSLAIILGFRNEALLGLMITFCAPSAVSSYSLAAAFNADAQLAGQSLVLTTILCVFTLFAWIFGLSYFQLI